jgi:N utilization substance protein A
VLHVGLDEAEKVATIVVPDRQLSLAIGKEGQNARLTARLTGWKIEIRGETEYEEAPTEAPQPAVEAAEAEVPPVVEQAEAVLAAAEPVQVAEAAEPAAEEAEALPEPAVAEVVVEAPIPEEVAAREAAELAELAALEVAERAEAAEQAKEPEGLSADDDSIWVVPGAVRETSVLRFAEDIMPERGRVRETTRGGRAADDAPRVAAKSKKGKRSKAPSQPGGGR